jgi:hypothetical protein
MSNQFQQIDKQRDALLAEARTLTESGLQGDDLARFEAIESEVADLAKRRAAFERMRTGLADGTLTREPGDARSTDDTRGPQFMRRVEDPWQAHSHYDTAQEMRDRALAANERVDGEHIAPEDRARIERMIRSDDSNAEYIVGVSDPNYRSAFLKVLRDPQRGHIGFTSNEAHAYSRCEEMRAALNLSGAAALLPYYLDPQIVLTNTGSVGNFRDFCRNETIGAATWHGVTSAGISAEWPGEAAESADATPTVTAATVTAYRLSAYAQVSYEVWQDSNFAEQLPLLFADAQRRAEATAFSTGSGTNQPTGVVTTISGVTASRVAATTNGQWNAVDLFSLGQNLPARYQKNAAWLSNYTWEYQIRNFAGSATPLASTF